MSQRNLTSDSSDTVNAQSSKKTLLGYFGSKPKPSTLFLEEAPTRPLALTTEAPSSDVQCVEGVQLGGSKTETPDSRHNGTLPASQHVNPVIPLVRKRLIRKTASEQGMSSKPLFPIFAKQSSSQSTAVTPRASSPDVEVIHILESSPPPPPSAGLSRQNPIELLETSPSPEKPTRKPVFVREEAVPLRRFPKFRPEPDKLPLAPYPEKGVQHVNLAATNYDAAPLSNIARRSSRKDTELDTIPWTHSGHASEGTPAHRSPTYAPVTLHQDRASFANSLPADHLSAPAIVRMLGQSEMEHNKQEDWVQRWRPLRAVEVLGNETHATYLRDWLKTLSVHLQPESAPPSPVKPQPAQAGRASKSLKRKEPSKPPKRQIIRAVSRSKRRKRQRLDSDEEDDWIVHSNDDEEETDYTDYDDLDLLSNVQTEDEEPPDSRPESLASDDEAAPLDDTWDFSGWLTNTILLSGPPGCGKTAAVYACAAELDWEIFEVYPGIGKRSGANVEGLVGDVGKNHLVQLQRRKRFGSLVNGVEVDPSSNEDGPSGVRQSAILLDEVDVLFKDDVNFWPSVIDLVRECKRPVILTCSDESLVPVEELPLQTILKFEACSPELATSYLLGVAWAEGYLLNRTHVAELYKTVYPLNPFDLPDIPLHPLHTPFPCPDLRKSLHKLQFLCSSVSGQQAATQTTNSGFEPLLEELHEPIAAEKQNSTWKSMRERIESISLIDSSNNRAPGTSAWGLTLNNYGALSDNDTEIGREMLPDPCQGVGTDLVWDFYDRDAEMANLGINLACGASPFSEDTYRLSRDRAAYQSEMLKVLEKVLDVGGPLMPRGVVFTEYEAWVRRIVAADDANERDDSKQFHQRRTRSRQVYHRMLRLGEEELSIVRRTGLRTAR